MNYTKLIEKIEKQIDFKPKQADLCRILGVTTSAMARRSQRDSSFSIDEIEKIERFYAIKLDRELENNCVNLDFYPSVFGSCGVGAMVFDESKEKISVSKDTIANYSPNNNYSVISARGSSMSPVINDSDKLVIQKWNGEQIIDDSVYLFKYNDELFIKRLVKNIDQIICISENPRFEDRIIKDLKNFSIIGKVVGLFREKV